MTPHKKEDWRTCANCVHNYVCRFRKEDKEPNGYIQDNCVNHIYDADPKRYGDLQELVDPICEWVKNHYPSDGKLVVDKYSATFEMPIQRIFRGDTKCQTARK